MWAEMQEIFFASRRYFVTSNSGEQIHIVELIRDE